MSLASYDVLPLIGMAAMKVYQMAWAVKRVERIWRRAWDEASRPIEAP